MAGPGRRLGPGATPRRTIRGGRKTASHELRGAGPPPSGPPACRYCAAYAGGRPSESRSAPPRPPTGLAAARAPLPITTRMGWRRLRARRASSPPSSIGGRRDERPWRAAAAWANPVRRPLPAGPGPAHKRRRLQDADRHLRGRGRHDPRSGLDDSGLSGCAAQTVAGGPSDRRRVLPTETARGLPSAYAGWIGCQLSVRKNCRQRGERDFENL